MSKALPLSLALVVGVACGSAARNNGTSLPAAGSARDDGSGLLARASAGLGSSPGYGNTSYAKSWGGYGGTGYGAAAYGGGIYAAYKFERRPVRDADVGRYDPHYVINDKLSVGRIRGRLRWATRPARVRPTACAGETSPSSPHPSHAVVFLRDIKRGKGFPSLHGAPNRVAQRGGQLRVDRCRIDPYVQVVGPIGSTLSAHLEHDGPDLLTAKPSLALRFTSRGDLRYARLETRGPLEVIASGGARAWLYVAGHPYHVNVDPDGSFALLEVPVGTYQLVAWHPPLPGSKLPVVTRTKVTVRAGKEARANLTLRSR